MNDHEPKHGSVTVHRNGKIEYIDLCQCCKTERPVITGNTNIAAEAQAVVDVLHRHVSSVESRSKSIEDQFEALRSDLELREGFIEKRFLSIGEELKLSIIDSQTMGAASRSKLNSDLLSRISDLKSETEALVKSMGDKLSESETSIGRLLSAAQAMNDESFKYLSEDLSLKISDLRSDMRVSFDALDTTQTTTIRNAVFLESRISALERRTLWDLIKRCFARS